MDDAADGLLALSTTAAALVDEANDIPDDDRSSSLSELDDAPENPDLELESAPHIPPAEADSEAETERLEESPEKSKKPFGISPSKLAHSISVDDRPEIEALTDSNASSPISPLEDSDPEQSEAEAEVEDGNSKLLDAPLNNKRKRLSDFLESDDQDRVRRRRTGSVESEEEKDIAESDNEDLQSRGSREPTVEPLNDGVDPVNSDGGDDNDKTRARAKQQDTRDSSDEGKTKQPAVPSRSSRRRAKSLAEPDVNELEEENEAEESDEDVDADDADAQAKSEEEQAKRAAAMEALSVLEQRFATLRDRLYDEKIAQLNIELAQLAEPEPSNPELLRQLACVQQHRDKKFAVEQRLLVFKIEALKRKSIAERSQTLSAFFQTVRDVREKHLERISEQFYRIQRDRFKSSVSTPLYTIPFSEKRSQQITQLTAYNKEVSILAGFAKYKGFPAAPDLPATSTREVDDDMEKMGISLNPVRTKVQQRIANTFENSLSAKAAGEQFLEQTPWANPQHPMSRLGLNRQTREKSPFNESYVTPAHQQRTVDSTRPINSASTIPEHPSQPASAFNTPHDQVNGQNSNAQHNGEGQAFKLHLTSPTETRRANSSINRPASQPRDISTNQVSSPLAARAITVASPGMPTVQDEKIPRDQTASPYRQPKENPPRPNIAGQRVGVQ